MNAPFAFALIVLACAGGMAAGWMLRAARTPAAAPGGISAGYPPAHHGPTTVVPTGAGAVPAAVPAPLMPVEPDRRLIIAMIGLHDLDGGISARERIREDLAQVGVQILDAAPGTVFDSAHQKAVTGVAAQTPDQVGTIAALIRPGWTSPAGIIRFPEIAVYIASNDPMPT
ncbi:hypothetical protein [Rhodococcus sp. ARC_M6]|uniref:hypothetical protein n=1 Tax=Rhodococcus sp. ARC_M6 TaxID=2928852 RepID=UPI001FB1E91C|nr:hypothetical protein [Rhodococcus sp. ARC_M6]MCJ0907113.1 hypothetical protein [Rhodococcus sp. ARC_M6]